MKFSKSRFIGAALTAGILTFAQAEQALCQDAPAEKSQVLLQKVKQGESEMRIAMKQKEIDRAKEDLEKGKSDVDALQKNLDATGALITESSGNLNQLAAEEKRLEQAVDLNELKIEAERKKSEGLKSLSAAQSRELEAMNQRMAQMDVQSRVRESEMQLLAAGKPVPGEDSDENGSPDLRKLRKMLASNEVKTAAAERISRTAMKTASAKLQLADEAAARAKRRSDELQNPAPAPVAEQTTDETKPDATSAPVPKAMPVEKEGAAKQ